MHRSGTSALAGTLNLAGVYLGGVLNQSIQRNPKGLWEAPAVLFMHQNLLEANGGDWHSPPEAVHWGKLHEAVRDLFIESRAGQPIWGFKDPRALLTIEGWFKVLPEMECVGIFRHPAEVALSIHSRNQFDMEKCFEIWWAYNRRLLTLKQAHGFPIIEFVSDGPRMAQSITALLDQLGLAATPEALGFYETEMKHHDHPAVDLPPHVMELYEALQGEAL